MSPSQQLRERFEEKFFYSEQEMGRKESILAFLSEEIERAREEDRKGLREEVKRMWDYPCSCANRLEFCVHDYSIMQAVLSLLSKETK